MAVLGTISVSSRGSGKFRPGRLLADSYGSFSADRRIHAVVHLHMIGKASGSGKGIRGNRGSKGSLLISMGYWLLPASVVTVTTAFRINPGRSVDAVIL